MSRAGAVRLVPLAPAIAFLALFVLAPTYYHPLLADAAGRWWLVGAAAAGMLAVPLIWFATTVPTTERRPRRRRLAIASVFCLTLPAFCTVIVAPALAILARAR